MPRNQRAQAQITAAVDAKNSNALTIPEGTVAIGVSAPALDSAATWAIQMYDPIADAWLAPEQWDPTDGVLTAMTGLAASKVVGFLAALFFCDTFRIVTSADQSTNKVFQVFFR